MGQNNCETQQQHQLTRPQARPLIRWQGRSRKLQCSCFRKKFQDFEMRNFEEKNRQAMQLLQHNNWQLLIPPRPPRPVRSGSRFFLRPDKRALLHSLNLELFFIQMQKRLNLAWIASSPICNGSGNTQKSHIYIRWTTSQQYWYSETYCSFASSLMLCKLASPPPRY